MTQLMAELTRLTASSQSLIHLILVSNPGIVMMSGVVLSTISGQYVITAKLNLKTPKTSPTISNLRSYTDYKASEFPKDISRTPSGIRGGDTIDDVSDRVGTFNDLFLSVLDKHASMKQH